MFHFLCFSLNNFVTEFPVFWQRVANWIKQCNCLTVRSSGWEECVCVGGGGGGGGEVGGVVIIACIWHSTDVCRMAPFFSAARYMISPLFSMTGPNIPLTFKTPRKSASENVVCLCRLLNILANFSNLFLHTVWTQIRLLLIWVHTVCKNDLKSQANDKADDNCCDWRFKG